VIIGDPAARARASVEFADGVELGGGPLVAYARRLRLVAGDVLELVERVTSLESLVRAQDQRIETLTMLLERRNGKPMEPKA